MNDAHGVKWNGVKPHAKLAIRAIEETEALARC